MAHHIINMNELFLNDLLNIFLIRDSTKVIRSISKIIKHPTMQDIGIKKEWELYNNLTKNNIYINWLFIILFNCVIILYN